MDMASLVEIKQNPKIPDIAPGDTVKVSAKIVEGGKERIQVFQGVVIKVRRGGAGASFTVRHVAYGIGVERTFPLSSPLVEKVEVVRHGKVRRARLYYLRGLSGKAARRKIKRVDRKAKKIGEEVLVAEPEEEPEEILEPVLERETEVVPGEEPEAVMEGESAPEEALETEAVPGEEPEAVTEKEPAAEEIPETEAVLEVEPVQEEPVLEKESEPVLEQETEAVLEEKPEPEPVLEKEPEAEVALEKEPEPVVEPEEEQKPENETP